MLLRSQRPQNKHLNCPPSIDHLSLPPRWKWPIEHVSECTAVWWPTEPFVNQITLIFNDTKWRWWRRTTSNGHNRLRNGFINGKLWVNFHFSTESNHSTLFLSFFFLSLKWHWLIAPSQHTHTEPCGRSWSNLTIVVVLSLPRSRWAGIRWTCAGNEPTLVVL